MASHENREPLIWAACVLGLAALFVLIGLVTPKRSMVHQEPTPVAPH
jgi:hypothetical protein